MLGRAIVGIAVGCVLSACAGSQSLRPAGASDLWRWVPSSSNALFWADVDGFRRSSLDDLLDNDIESVRALAEEFGGNLPGVGSNDATVNLALGLWRKLDAVLVASKLEPAAPAGTPPPAERPDESVMVFIARWTAADVDALAAATEPAPVAQAAAPAPPPTPTPEPPTDAATPDGGGMPWAQALGSPSAPPPASPPAEPLKRSRVAGRAGWSWGTAVLVPVGGGVWLMGARAAVESLLQTAPAEPSRAHPELASGARDLGLFEQTVAFVGRQDSVTGAGSLLPATGVAGRTPWPEVIATGDWFAFGMQVDAGARLRLVVQPSDPSRVQATATRMSGWRDRFVRSGLAGLVYLREAFADAHVTSRNDRVDLSAVVDDDRTHLAYSRIAGLGMTAAVVAYVFITAIGSVFGAIGSELGQGLDAPAP
jgi:hypothetical protein